MVPSTRCAMSDSFRSRFVSFARVPFRRLDLETQLGHPTMGMIERLLKPRLAPLLRAFNARSRPSGSVNAARLRERGEKLETIVFRDAVPDDINALAELHVTMWN